MSNVANSNPLVNSFFKEPIPDSSLLFDSNNLVYFLSDNLLNNHDLYQIFQSLLTSNSRSLPNKFHLFTTFMHQLFRTFIDQKSLRINFHTNYDTWYKKRMIPELYEQGYLQIRKGFFDKTNNGYNRQTRVYPTMKTAQDIFNPMSGLQIQMTTYPFVYKDSIKVKNKRYWKIDPIKSKRPPNYIQKSEKLLYKLSEFNQGRLCYITDVLPSILYRVFNGSWKSNGRMYVFNDRPYTPFRYFKQQLFEAQQITDIPPVELNYQFLSKEDRGKILIAGEKSCELDFVGMHPRMLYAKIGTQYDNDPYLVIVDNPDLRKFAKKAMYCALYSTTKDILKRAIQFQINKSPTIIKDLLKEHNLHTATLLLSKMEQVHHPISSFFGSDISLSLCFIESEIMLDLAKILYKYDIHFMLIHDSVRIPKDNADFVQKQMKHLYKKHTGFNAQVKMEN